jgi:CheY-like chemotaxis protein
MSTALLAEGCQERPDYVLVVAEDVFLRKTLRTQLEEMGHVVQEALSVARAVARLEAGPPWLLLLDLWIGRGGGLELLEQLQERGDIEPVPVILVGAETRGNVRRRAYDLGVVGQIPLGSLSRIGPWLEAALPGSGSASVDSDPAFTGGRWPDGTDG